MSAEPPGGGLFDAVLARGAVREAVGDRAWLQAMLDVEAALARALAGAGLIAAEDTEAIARACRAEAFDVAAIGAGAAAPGNPVPPLVRALTDAVGEPAGGHVHRGATSQDVLDTAAMLVVRDARTLIVDAVDGAARACAELAQEHRGTTTAARTLLQQAVPTTFGLKAAGWLVALLDARRRLLGVQLQAQLGGAGGTLALFGRRGLEVLALYAEELELAEPVVAWHALRGPVLELVGALDAVAGAAAKVGLDVVLLAQTEVGEVAVAGPGASSTMPHKRNPVPAVLARACAVRVHALTRGFTAEHEHERAAGAWHAEWAPLSDALALTGAAAWWAQRTLEGLEVDAARMRDNLRAETLAEAERRGDQVRGPEDYLGSADELVDRALALYRSELT